MGACFSAPVKDKSPFHSGENSKNVNDLSISSSSKVPSVPPTPLSQGVILQSLNLKRFRFSDIKMATRNFRHDTLLGEGSFGSVFKGWMNEQSFAAAKPGTGIAIAVKKLNQESFQGHKEWLAEVNCLGQLSHPNLVQLIGYCLEDEQRLLVYEFMPRGCLENHLFTRSYFQPLSWSLRLKAALGAAKGLAFLHSTETNVISRDFKTSNVLLDSNYNAKISDFGLVKDRTYDYAAPEYIAMGMQMGRFTAKSCVFSFGVFLLEMLLGRRLTDRNRPPGVYNLVEWAKPYLAHKHKIFRVLDNRLEDQYTLDAAHAVANVTLRCLLTDPRSRPNMGEVVEVLEQLQDPNGARPRRHSSRGTRPRRASDAGDGGGPTAYHRPQNFS